ncbi:MAG: HDIG domain-containing protein [Clostridia bacterium]|nr:HDIG domain-containing protein [Clostridia bacterium]
MALLTLDQAKTILQKHVQEPHLLTHALAVSAAMGAMAEHFGADKAHWEAVGYLHDVDYEKYPEEHLQHTRELLEAEGVEEADIRAILSHGYGLCSDVKPETELEKSLFTVDELTGIVQAASLMRPTGISDLEVKSLKKKYKDKKFAAKCSREVIDSGCEMLGMENTAVMEIVIRGMQQHMEALGIGPKAE